jgi:hypothetical protein
MAARSHPTLKRSNLNYGDFFRGGCWNDRTWSKAAEKLTNRGDAATAF